MNTYDIKCGTGNEKTGASFSLLAGDTCPGKTKACDGCYATTGRMAMHQYADKRYGRNTTAMIQALKAGEGAQALTAAVVATNSLTIRIHDSGDFFSPAYVQAWIDTCKALPTVQFWAYTRSWRLPAIAAKLDELAALPNVAIWRSADTDIWVAALAAHKTTPWAGIAFMQQEGDGEADIAAILNKSLGKGQFINFPTHTTGKHLRKGVQVQAVRNCPAITGSRIFSGTAPKCIQCRLCLPTTGGQ